MMLLVVLLGICVLLPLAVSVLVGRVVEDGADPVLVPVDVPAVHSF